MKGIQYTQRLFFCFWLVDGANHPLGGECILSFLHCAPWVGDRAVRKTPRPRDQPKKRWTNATFILASARRTLG